jgi:hypothetical protein
MVDLDQWGAPNGVRIVAKYLAHGYPPVFAACSRYTACQSRVCKA